MNNRVAGFWLGVVSKVTLIALLAFGTFSGAQQFEGKAFTWRLATYPLAGLIVPAGWLLAHRPRPYPYAADNLLVALAAKGRVVKVIGESQFWRLVESAKQSRKTKRGRKTTRRA